MIDPLDHQDSDSDRDSKPLPPPPPGISIPPPSIDIPINEIDLPPPEQNVPQFGFSPPQSPDSDLLDAAGALSHTSPTIDQKSPSDFKSVWDRRKTSDPSINQSSRDNIYERINRISSGKGDSLMERYADRFGSDLDREIIVLRKKEQQDLSSIKPTVELISSPTNTEMSLNEFMEAMDDAEFVTRVANKTGVSVDKIAELDIESMTTFFESADADNSGTLDFDEFVNGIIQSFRSNDEDFSHFFTVVNGLLGELPDDKANAFIESEGFEMFREVGAAPESTEVETRGAFFTMVNELLVDLPDLVMKSFTESSDFDLYKQIAERYGD